jgi:Rrf2 family transcriptional regulator, cysteine metabolism repressor
MMFSTKAEYGVRVMVELARRAGTSDVAEAEPISLSEIAEHDGMPLAYLEHLVAKLRKAGLVDSRRGSRGGYLLARSAEEITMAEVVEALEGSIAPIECISQSADGSIVCSRESGRAEGGRAQAGSHSQACPTKLLWTRVRGAIVRTLRDTTLADLTVSPAAALSAAADAVAGHTPPASAMLPALDIEPLPATAAATAAATVTAATAAATT